MARPRLDHPTYRLTRRGGRFYVRWWEGGDHRRISTGTADEPEARRFLAQFVAGRGTPEPPAHPTIDAILTGYLEDRKPVVRGYASMETCAKAVRRHLGELQADHLTRERARFYASRRRAEGYMVGAASARRKKPVQPGTILRELLTLRAALKWAVRESWIPAAPHIEVPRQPAPRDRWLTREEADRLIASAKAPHVKLFLTLALYTAGRAGALLELTWDRVNLESGMVDLGKAPGGKGRAVVPAPAPLLAALREARAGATTAHVIAYADRPVRSVKTGTRAAAIAAGLPGVTPHVLRHTTATWQAQRGVPMVDIANYLGHRDSRTTERVYAHHSPEFLRRAALALE